jgi:hypothetical protein
MMTLAQNGMTTIQVPVVNTTLIPSLLLNSAAPVFQEMSFLQLIQSFTQTVSMMTLLEIHMMILAQNGMITTQIPVVCMTLIPSVLKLSAAPVTQRKSQFQSLHQLLSQLLIQTA